VIQDEQMREQITKELNSLGVHVPDGEKVALVVKEKQ